MFRIPKKIDRLRNNTFTINMYKKNKFTYKYVPTVDRAYIIN